MSNNSHTPLNLGLIGYPLDHSLSPILHQAALSACGLPGQYRLYPIPPMPGGAGDLGALLAQVREGALHGLNVTIPHKQSVLGYLDELTPAARAIGAVNTIYRAGSRLVGENTDSRGFTSDLYAQMGVQDSERAAIVLGAGGSARAVVYSLLEDGWQTVVAARRLSQAHELVESFRTSLTSQVSPTAAQTQAIELNPSQLRATVSRLSVLNSRDLLIVNTTPVGMTPYPDACPWPEEIPFPSGTLVYDLVYNPSDTRLVQMARSQGIQAASGLGMLVEQAALSFEIWSGCSASRSTMRAALNSGNNTIRSNIVG